MLAILSGWVVRHSEKYADLTAPISENWGSEKTSSYKLALGPKKEAIGSTIEGEDWSFYYILGGRPILNVLNYLQKLF